MRTDRTSAAEADWLNQIWDSLVDDEVPVSETATPDSTTDRQRETLIFHLESLLPSPSHLEKTRLNAHVEQLMRKDHRTNTAELAPSASPPRKATDVQANWRTRFVPVIRTFDRIAAAGLILAVVAALVLLVPVRGLLDGNEPSRFAAMLGFDENESTEQNVGSQSTITLDIRPGDYEGGTVEVGFWEVTLAPGSAMFAPTSGDPISEPFGFSVSQESVLFGGDDTWRLVEEGGSVGDLAGIDSVRNPNTSPAHMLVLAPMPPNAGFPLTIGAWSPGDAAASPVDGAAESETDPVLLSSVELDDSAAFQYRVLVSENILAPGMGIGDVESFGPPSSTLHAITVREGQLAVAPDESLSTPEVTQDLVPGDTVQLEAVGVWDSDMRVIGWENAIVLGLLTMPAAENHTLDQTLESIAPFWGEWTVPASGEVNLVVRRLALVPGATYNLPTGAGVLCHVASGSVDVQNSDSGNTVNVAPGGTVAQIPGTVLELSSSESGRAEVIQTLIFDGPLDIITERVVGGRRDRDAPDRVGNAAARPSQPHAGGLRVQRRERRRGIG